MGHFYSQKSTILSSAVEQQQHYVRHSIVASIPACHAGDRGSIPRDGAFLHYWFSGKIQRCHRWAPSSILG